MVVLLKATLVFIFGPNLKTKTLLRPRPKLNNKEERESMKDENKLKIAKIFKLNTIASRLIVQLGPRSKQSPGLTVHIERIVLH